MGILLRSKGNKWQAVEKVKFETENQLQEMLYNSPELISEAGDGAVVFTRESGLPGSGYTDLIGVTSEGNVLVVETKLARNREIRREVIGQVLEYAAHLWGMSFEAFDSYFIKNEGASVIELLQRKASLDEKVLREAIATTLSNGTFDLLIGVDSINPELKKIIAFMSSRKAQLRLEALEFEAYQHGEIEMLVPHRHGQIEEPGRESSGKTTMPEIINACSERGRNLLSQLAERWAASGGAIVPGVKGASMRARIDGRDETIFCVYPEHLEVWLKQMQTRGAPTEAMQSYRKRLAGISGFSPKFLKDAIPQAKWASIEEPAITSFLKVTEDVLRAWRDSRGKAGSVATASGA